MLNTRIDMRLNQEIKVKAEKAAALLGIKSLTEYVVKLMDEDASKVIKEHESILVENNRFDQFMRVCDNVGAPNKALIAAAKLTKALDIK
ncbi:MAG: DUF1778 domain-containing protein [Proteobacteria bacterium]|nr:DUF1778 domain-containing protein [Pseudomonadota bacterium]